jgi:hypothetical protein
MTNRLGASAGVALRQLLIRSVRQQTDRQRADLHHRIGRPGRDLPCRQHQPAGRRALVDAAPQQLDGDPAQAREHQHRAGKASNRDQAQHDVAAGGQQQRCKTCDPDTQHRERGRLEVADVAPDHAQRRHLRQLQHRWQTEGDQQGQAHAQTEQHWPDRGRRQTGIDQTREQGHEDEMHAKANGHAQRAGSQPDHGEFGAVGHGDGALAQAQHPQHGTVIQMAGRIPARRQGHCDRAEHGRQQRHQVQEFLGPVHGLAHVAAPAVQRFDPAAAQFPLLHPLRRPLAELTHRRIVPGDRKAVAHPAGRLDQAGGGQVGLVEHHAWREVDKAAAPVRLNDDDAADLEAGVPKQQIVADAQVQRLQQGAVEPGLARCRHGPRLLPCPIRRVGDHQAATQRIPLRHRLECHQLAGPAAFVARACHGRETDRGGRLQPQPAGLGDHGRRRGVVGGQHEIAPQQLARVALQPPLEPVGKKAHRGQCGDGQGDGHDQQAQFAGAKVTPQRTQAQAPERGIHPATLADPGCPRTVRAR